MDPKTSADFSADQLDLLIDCIHDRFMAVSNDIELHHPPASKARLLDELSRLHAVVQFAAERAAATRRSRGQA